jgi:hypothetical protein
MIFGNIMATILVCLRSRVNKDQNIFVSNALTCSFRYNISAVCEEVHTANSINLATCRAHILPS